MQNKKFWKNCISILGICFIAIRTVIDCIDYLKHICTAGTALLKVKVHMMYSELIAGEAGRHSKQKSVVMWYHLNKLVHLKKKSD